MSINAALLGIYNMMLYFFAPAAVEPMAHFIHIISRHR